MLVILTSFGRVSLFNIALDDLGRNHESGAPPIKKRKQASYRFSKKKRLLTVLLSFSYFSHFFGALTIEKFQHSVLRFP